MRPQPALLIVLIFTFFACTPCKADSDPGARGKNKQRLIASTADNVERGESFWPPDTEMAVKDPSLRGLVGAVNGTSGYSEQQHAAKQAVSGALKASPDAIEVYRDETPGGDVLLPPGVNVTGQNDVSLRDLVGGVNGTSRHADLRNEAQDAISSAQPASPEAAEFYETQRRSDSQNEERANSWAEVHELLLKNAKGQGISPEYLDAFIKENQDQGEYAGKHLLVFVSSSMPESSLRQWLNVLGDKDNVVFVLRGLIDNDVSKIIPTQAWVQNLLCRKKEDESECYRTVFDINPVLFERFEISAVPALVYVPEPAVTIPDCEQPALNPQDFLVYYGDFNPAYIIEKMLKLRSDDTVLQQIHEETRGKSFYNVSPKE